METSKKGLKRELDEVNFLSKTLRTWFKNDDFDEIGMHKKTINFKLNLDYYGG